MKNLVKFLVLVGVFSMTTELFAQNFGVRAGLNVSKINGNNLVQAFNDEFNWKNGFHVGATAEFPMTDVFSFETGLYFSTKGYDFSEVDNFFGITNSFIGSLDFYYLDVPLTAKASFDLGGVRVYGLLGPYIGLGLSGKLDYDSVIGMFENSHEIAVRWGADKDYKRLDYGLTVGAGVEIQSILIGLTYNLGLANITAETANDASANHRVIAVSVGYVFGR